MGVINGVRVQVDIGEFLGNQVEQAGLGQTFNLGIEVEALEDVARGQGKALDVRVEVFPDMVLVAEQLAEVEWRCVVEALPSLAYQERARVQAGRSLGLKLGQDCQFGTLKHAIEAAQTGEGQDDLPYSDCL